MLFHTANVVVQFVPVPDLAKRKACGCAHCTVICRYEAQINLGEATRGLDAFRRAINAENSLRSANLQALKSEEEAQRKAEQQRQREMEAERKAQQERRDHALSLVAPFVKELPLLKATAVIDVDMEAVDVRV